MEEKIWFSNIFEKASGLAAGKMEPFIGLNKFNVKIERSHGVSDYRHTNKKDELILVMEGEVSLQTSDGELNLKKGDITLLPKGLSHGPIRGNNAILLIFDEK